VQQISSRLDASAKAAAAGQGADEFEEIETISN